MLEMEKEKLIWGNLETDLNFIKQRKLVFQCQIIMQLYKVEQLFDINDMPELQYYHH
jgi:hypothetical protein